MTEPAFLQRFLRNGSGLVGLTLVTALLALALIGPVAAPYGPDEQFRDALLRDGLPVSPFSVAGHSLGGDAVGHDYLSLLLHGGRASLTIALSATILAVLLGTLAGITGGYFGGAIDSFWNRTIDLLLSLPFLLLAIALQRIVSEPSTKVTVLLMAGLSWTSLGRVTRTKVKQIASLEFVAAAKALGLPTWRILLRHVLPSSASPIIVLGTTMVARMIIFESALSFLGVGPPESSWGSMLHDAEPLLHDAPHLMWLPAAAIVATVFGFNLLGDALRDATEPKAG